MWKHAIAISAPLLAILSYIGAINSNKNSFLVDMQQAELQCRMAVEEIDLKLSGLSDSDRSGNQATFLQNQRDRFKTSIGFYMGKHASLLHGNLLYLTPSQVETDRRKALSRACIS